MFRSCAFCNASFDGDGGPSGLGVGRRIAFDEWKGQLWVVCPRCSRWKLTPFDDRLEHIEAVARAAATGRIAASTDQVSLIRFQQYDFVRIGKPPRVELSTWRYAERRRAAEPPRGACELARPTLFRRARPRRLGARDWHDDSHPLAAFSGHGK